VAATSGVLRPVGVPGSGCSDQRMLALLVSRREASQLNWRVTDSLGFLVPSTHNCAPSDSRFEMQYETAAAATFDHMKQPTRTCVVVTNRGWDTNDFLPCEKARATCGDSAGRQKPHILTWFCGGFGGLQFVSRPTAYQHIESPHEQTA